jgi:hypothetical protein
MLTRRTFLQTAALPTLATAAPASQPKRLAIATPFIATFARLQHMGDRFLVGYPHAGAWHKPDMKVVSLYVDQKPQGDQTGRREFDSAGLTPRSPRHCVAWR